MSMTKITVLKPFVFSAPGIEKFFNVGDHDVDAAIANHPFIKAGADGAVKIAPAVDPTKAK